MLIEIAARTTPTAAADTWTLWQLLILAACMLALLVIVSCLLIRLVTSPRRERPTVMGALCVLQERRDRGEISERQFWLARAMLHAAQRERGDDIPTASSRRRDSSIRPPGAKGM